VKPDEFLEKKSFLTMVFAKFCLTQAPPRRLGREHIIGTSRPPAPRTLDLRYFVVLGYEYDTGVRSTVFFCDLHLSDIRVRYWSFRRMSRRMLAPTSDYDIRLRRPTTKCLGILRPITYLQFYREQRAPSTQRHRALYYSPCSGAY